MVNPIDALGLYRAAVDQAVDEHTARVLRTMATAWNDLAARLQSELAHLIDAGLAELDWERARQIHLSLATIIDSEIEQMVAALDRHTQEATRRTMDAALTRWVDIITTQAPVRQLAPAVLPPPPGVLARIAARVQQQVTVRHYHLQEAATRAMKRELVASIAAGDNPNDAAGRMIGRVMGEFNGGITRATVIARTEMLDAARAATHAAMQENADILAYWVWWAALTERTCPACWAMHGTRHPIAEPGPIDHHQGRCVAMPVTKVAVEAKDKRLIIPEDAGLRRFEKLPAAKQKAILGPSHHEAWQDGRFPPDQWAVRRTHWETIDGQPTQTWRDSIHAGTPTPKKENPK